MTNHHKHVTLKSKIKRSNYETNNNPIWGHKIEFQKKIITIDGKVIDVLPKWGLIDNSISTSNNVVHFGKNTVVAMGNGIEINGKLFIIDKLSRDNLLTISQEGGATIVAGDGDYVSPGGDIGGMIKRIIGGANSHNQNVHTNGNHSTSRNVVDDNENYQSSGHKAKEKKGEDIYQNAGRVIINHMNNAPYKHNKDESM